MIHVGVDEVAAESKNGTVSLKPGEPIWAKKRIFVLLHSFISEVFFQVLISKINTLTI